MLTKATEQANTKPPVRHLAYSLIILLLSHGEDEIFIETTFPSPRVGPLRLHFRVAKNEGAAYVREHFGQEPDRTVDTRMLDD